VYGAVVYVLMRVPLTSGCLCWPPGQAAYEHQCETPSDHQPCRHNHCHQQQQRQPGDCASQDSQSKIVNDLSQQIIINSAQVLSNSSTLK